MSFDDFMKSWTNVEIVYLNAETFSDSKSMFVFFLFLHIYLFYLPKKSTIGIPHKAIHKYDMK